MIEIECISFNIELSLNLLIDVMMKVVIECV